VFGAANGDAERRVAGNGFAHAYLRG
jgi:hypothetical protein